MRSANLMVPDYMMLTNTEIPGHEQVIAILGHWPSFHDAEVLRLTLLRGEDGRERKAEAQLDIQVREVEIRNAGTAQYDLATTKNILIQFVFTAISALKLDDFNFQNVINGLHLRRISASPDAAILVEVESTYGMGASWSCQAVRVVGVQDLVA